MRRNDRIFYTHFGHRYETLCLDKVESTKSLPGFEIILFGIIYLLTGGFLFCKLIN
jgi:hypothetical protein